MVGIIVEVWIVSCIYGDFYIRGIVIVCIGYGISDCISSWCRIWNINFIGVGIEVEACCIVESFFLFVGNGW